MTTSVNTVSSVYFDAARPWEEAYRNLEAKSAETKEEAAVANGGGGDAQQTTDASQLVTLLREQNRLQAEQNALLEKLVASGRVA